MNKEQANKLENHHAKAANLYNEYQQSLDYEKCSYDVVITDQQYKQLGLIKIATKEMVVDGPKSRLLSYIRLRNIDVQTIYNRNLLGLD